MMPVMSDDLEGLTIDQKIDYLFEMLYNLHSTAYMVRINSEYLEKQGDLVARIENLEKAASDCKLRQETMKRCIETPHRRWKDILKQYTSKKIITGYEQEFLFFLCWRSKNEWPVYPTERQAQYAMAFLDGYEHRHKARGARVVQRIKSFLLNYAKGVVL